LYSPHNDDDEEDDEDEVECESDPLEELIEMRFMPPSSDQCESIMNYDDLKESPAKVLDNHNYYGVFQRNFWEFISGI
jgi:hypothetical protein